MRRPGEVFPLDPVEVVVLLLLASLVMLAIVGYDSNEAAKHSMGPNGLVETRCHNGREHSIGPSGTPVQTMGEDGLPVPCGARLQKR